ncbi:hypothetical protein [Massilia sp. TSP1-1-2]|uniref:hypothetical protein n=1 Tax=unclassified Massilia TaxID=2609279 RepID=UPI003CF942C8
MNSLGKFSVHLRGKWLGLLYVYVSLMGWHVFTARSANLAVAIGLLTAVIVAFLLGDILLKVMLNDKETFDNLSFRLLSGVLTGIVLLYVLALVLRFGLLTDAAIIAIAAIAIWIFVRRGRWTKALSGGSAAESTFIALALLATTLWCRDLFSPISSAHSVTIVPAWQDVFYHLSQITAFAGSTGASTIYDVRMAGVVAHPYHFASYVVPALMVSAADSSAWVAYASFLVPVSILLTFFAAYALAAPVFGNWGAGVGALAVLILPDAAQQGFGNPFMSYHWLQQVAPASGYGVASAALSFLLMMEACRSRRIGLIFASYTFLLVTLVFKAQIFVAIALLVLLFPALFFAGLFLWQRCAIAALFTTVFIAVVNISQQLASVPVIRLDGSSLSTFSQSILNMQRPGLVKTLFSDSLPVTSGHGIMFALMLLVITFGFFPVAYGFLLKRLRREFEPVVWLFPILVAGTFLVMATGLALDDRHVGMPEELLHRPFVWAYFVLVLWATSGAYRLRFGDAPPGKSSAARWGWVVLVVTLVIPGDFGSRIQTMPIWNVAHPAFSDCLMRSADFIKAHSLASDIVQDAGNDPKLILTALSARKPYVIKYGGMRPPMAKRLQAIADIRSAATWDQASALGKQIGIAWWVTRPGASVLWRSVASQQAAFTCDKYQVFRF